MKISFLDEALSLSTIGQHFSRTRLAHGRDAWSVVVDSWEQRPFIDTINRETAA